MGLNLILMPLRDKRELAEAEFTGGLILGYDRLRFLRDYRIFAQITDVEGKSMVPDEISGGVEAIVQVQPLPPKVKIGIYGESGIRKTRKNPYGNEMVYTTAQEMRKLVLPQDVNPTNKAIMAYVRALQKDTPIILQWR